MRIPAEDCTGMNLLASEDTGDYDDHDDHDDHEENSLGSIYIAGSCQARGAQLDPVPQIP